MLNRFLGFLLGQIYEKESVSHQFFEEKRLFLHSVTSISVKMKLTSELRIFFPCVEMNGCRFFE